MSTVAIACSKYKCICEYQVQIFSHSAGRKPAVVLIEVMVLGKVQPREGVFGFSVTPLHADD